MSQKTQTHPLHTKKHTQSGPKSPLLDCQ